MKLKKQQKLNSRQDAINLYYNKHADLASIAEIVGKSKRTIYRWLKQDQEGKLLVQHPTKIRRERKKRYLSEIFDRILALKKELSCRTAVSIQQRLKKEYPTMIPSLSTIRKFLADHGLSGKNPNARQGYIKFQRKQPNDLWQIDIAGVQTVEPLGKLHLFALLDDCSRYIVAAFYCLDEKGVHAIELVKQAISEYGRPCQILADNGRQFKAILSELGTKYTQVLKIIGVEPIFASKDHPQSKGKLERWFATVIQSFLGEARFQVKNDPNITLAKFNGQLQEWIHWYNYEKPHRSLNRKCPADIYFHTTPRVFRPLEVKVSWDRWLSETFKRKVTKYDQIHYETTTFSVPTGYAGLLIELIKYDNHLDLYYHDQLLVSHPLTPTNTYFSKKGVTRYIAKAGTIGYNGKYYMIDYKLRGSQVEIQESTDGQYILVYLQDKLLKTIPKEI